MSIVAEIPKLPIEIVKVKYVAMLQQYWMHTGFLPTQE